MWSAEPSQIPYWNRQRKGPKSETKFRANATILLLTTNTDLRVPASTCWLIEHTTQTFVVLAVVQQRDPGQ